MNNIPQAGKILFGQAEIERRSLRQHPKGKQQHREQKQKQTDKGGPAQGLLPGGSGRPHRAQQHQQQEKRGKHTLEQNTGGGKQLFGRDREISHRKERTPCGKYRRQRGLPPGGAAAAEYRQQEHHPIGHRRGRHAQQAVDKGRAAAQQPKALG